MSRACRKSYLERHDVFIAYASSDLAVAASLCEVVEGQGLSVFIDKRMPTGKRFRDYLPEQLKRAKVVVMLWTDEFSRRNFTMSEVDLALKQGTYFGVMLEELEPEQLYGADQYNWFDLKGWRGDANEPRLDALLADIRHFIDEHMRADRDPLAASRIEATLPLASIPSGFSTNDQVSQSEVDEYREELLTCLVDRSVQTTAIDAVFNATDPRHYGVFLVEAYEKHWLRALAVHLALRQDQNYALLEDTKASLLATMQSTLIEPGDIGRGQDAFCQLLATAFRLSDRSEQAVGTELRERVMQGHRMTVIYVPLIDSRDHRHLAGIIGGTLDFLARLAPFENGRRLIVLFGYNCTAERSFNPMAWWRTFALKRLTQRGLEQLKPPTKIQSTHIDTWFNNFPARDKASYHFRAIEQVIKPRFDPPEHYYDTLKYPLAEALKAARHG